MFDLNHSFVALVVSFMVIILLKAEPFLQSQVQDYSAFSSTHLPIHPVQGVFRVMQCQLFDTQHILDVAKKVTFWSHLTILSPSSKSIFVATFACPVDRFSQLICGSLQILQRYHKLLLLKYCFTPKPCFEPLYVLISGFSGVLFNFH